ncbi:unnamed protein product [Schistocephalus solidus]|uniref:Lipid-A-disaccharide synthase n=1 Tax=Schistocephalus solidus TaxID=70667 RepID=A0A183SLH5_SCHSO|nr:unnamed protein product [Schistocephalus solidus]
MPRIPTMYTAGESRQDNFFEPYLQWFGLKGTYIPYVNDDLKEIERYRVVLTRTVAAPSASQRLMDSGLRAVRAAGVVG